MADLDRARADALARCTMMPASWDKRFARDVAGAAELTDKQVEQVTRLAWKYRRQMPQQLVPATKP